MTFDVRFVRIFENVTHLGFCLLSNERRVACRNCAPDEFHYFFDIGMGMQDRKCFKEYGIHRGDDFRTIEKQAFVNSYNQLPFCVVFCPYTQLWCVKFVSEHIFVVIISLVLRTNSGVFQ